MLKRTLYLCLTSLILGMLLLVSCTKSVSTTGTQETSAKQIVIKCSTTLPIGDPYIASIKNLENVISQATNGQVKLTLYDSGSLYADDDAVLALQIGDLEMMVGGAMLGPYIPVLDIIHSFPFLFDNRAHWERFAKSDAYKTVDSQLANFKLKSVGPVVLFGETSLLSTKSFVRTAEDLQGLRLIMQPTRVEEAWTLLGVNVMHVPATELVTAFQTGMADLNVAPLQAIKMLELYRYFDYLTLTNSTAWALGLVASADWWKTVPSDIQDTLVRVIGEAGDSFTQEAQTSEIDCLELYKSYSGTSVGEMTIEEKANLRQILDPIRKKYALDPAFRAIFDAVDSTR